MPYQCVVGYCPKLYASLQQMAAQEVPDPRYDPSNVDHPGYQYHAQKHAEQRETLIQDILDALINLHSLDEDLIHCLYQAYEAIDDDYLRTMVENAGARQLTVDEHGYYMAIERYTSDETNLY